MLLKKFAEYLKSNPSDSRFHIVRKGSGGDERALPEAQPELRSAEVVEGSDGLNAAPVGDPEIPQFTHFLDGIERTCLPCYKDMIPVLYGFVGAVVRERATDRRMRTFVKYNSENLYFSYSLIQPDELVRAGLQAKNTDRKDADAETHPMKLIEQARDAVRRERAILEQKAAEDWMENLDNDRQWLLWDGSITGGFETYKHPRIVGVIKSHQTQYFEAEEQRKILELRVGERSSVFKPLGRRRTPVLSWYLRLHPNAGRDIYFGLVRVEMAARDDISATADVVSRWILGERAPLSLPDGRWDKMLYPIRDCEQYLRSIAPSGVMMQATLAGL